VNEPFFEYVKNLEGAEADQETRECGLLRRLPFKVKKISN
jgi:hypothetical protein